MLRKIVFLLIVVIAFSKAAFAIDSYEPVLVEIILPITITADRDMSFGNIVKPDIGSCTLTLSAAGTTATSGTCAKGGTPNSAQFTVNGNDNSEFSIILNGGNPFVMTNGISNITVSSLTHSEGSTPSLSNGTRIFYVGGTATVSSTNTTGAYTGTFLVEVSY